MDNTCVTSPALLEIQSSISDSTQTCLLTLVAHLFTMSDNCVLIQQDTGDTALVPQIPEITNVPLRPESSSTATVDSMELTDPLPPSTSQDPWKGVLQIERLLYNAGLLYIFSFHNNHILNHSHETNSNECCVRILCTQHLHLIPL